MIAEGLHHVGNSTHLIVLGGVRILTDPWVTEPADHVLAHRIPPAPLPRDPDLVLITHAHGDHFDVAALEQLVRTAVVVCPLALVSRVLALGFSDVRGVVAGDRLEWVFPEATRRTARPDEPASPDSAHGSGAVGSSHGDATADSARTAVGDAAGHSPRDAAGDSLSRGRLAIDVVRGSVRNGDSAGDLARTAGDAAGDSLSRGRLAIDVVRGRHNVPEVCFRIACGSRAVFFGGDTMRTPEIDALARREPTSFVVLPGERSSLLGRRYVMTPAEAVELARLFGAQRAVLTHHETRVVDRWLARFLVKIAPPDRSELPAWFSIPTPGDHIPFPWEATS